MPEDAKAGGGGGLGVGVGGGGESFGDHCIPHLTFEEIQAQRRGG